MIKSPRNSHGPSSEWLIDSDFICTPVLLTFAVSGPAGLLEGSRAPHHCPHRMDSGVAAAIVEARRQHPSWGPRKLLAWLDDRRPDVEWPMARRQHGGRLAQAPRLGSAPTATTPL